MMRQLKRTVKWGKFTMLGRRRGIRIGRRCDIAFKSDLEGANVIGDGTAFSGHLGYASYIGERCQIAGSVGRFCSIAADVVTISGRHPATEFVSTHPAFYSLLGQSGFTYAKTQLFDEHVFADPDRKYGVVMGNDVLVSFGVRILEGVTIGDGAIVGAGSLVRSNIEPFCIYAGVPARKIGQRFDDDTIHQLMEIRWWDHDIAWIEAHAPLFGDVPRFLESCRSDKAQ